MAGMILVTGAAGKTGLALIKSLNAKGLETRALIHRPEREKLVKSAGAIEVQIGNMESRTDMAKAFKGIERVYFIVPNVHPKEIEIGKTNTQVNPGQWIFRIDFIHIIALLFSDHF